jgi:single stranded DNA-binding protein
MQDLNRVQLIGHLGHDPAVTYTATGTAHTTFSMATSTRWKDTDGRVQEATGWSRCAGLRRSWSVRTMLKQENLRRKRAAEGPHGCSHPCGS